MSFLALLLASGAAAVETNRPSGMLCQNSNATNAAFGDAADLALRDVTDPGSGEPLACVVCDCGSGIIYYWGTASCSGGNPTCTEIHDGVARALPEAAASMAVPALSLVGAAALAGGILTGAFMNRNRRS